MVCPLRVPAMIRTAEDCLHHQLDSLTLSQAAKAHEPAPGVKVEGELQCREPPATTDPVGENRLDALDRGEPELEELARDRVDLEVTQDVSEHLLVTSKERIQLGQADPEPLLRIADA